MKPSERVKQREAAAARRKADKEIEDLRNAAYDWKSCVRNRYDAYRYYAESNAYRPEITPEDLATVKPKQSIWQRIKGWFL